MDIRFLTDILSVSPQLKLGDIDFLKQQGFKSIICNRPDHEEASQTEFDVIKSEAAKHGIVTYYLPVKSGYITENNVADFKKSLENLPTPIVSYCRSGTRCATLWGLSMRDDMPTTEILDKAQKAGYDLSKALNT